MVGRGGGGGGGGGGGVDWNTDLALSQGHYGAISCSVAMITLSDDLTHVTSCHDCCSRVARSVPIVEITCPQSDFGYLFDLGEWRLAIHAFTEIRRFQLADRLATAPDTSNPLFTNLRIV